MIQSEENDYEFKILIIGNAKVGKSQIFLTFADSPFNDVYFPTIGVDFRCKSLSIDGKKVKLQIWDTAGQQRFRTITNSYYQGAHGMIIVYDVTEQGSFEDVQTTWMSEIQNHGEQNVELLLIGNKSDLDNHTVSTETANEYAQSKGMGFAEVSAKTSDQVSAAFTTLAQRLMKKKDSEAKN